MDIDPQAIRAKFGLDYVADERTFVMGIDQRFAARMAERFHGRRVLETCTGGGFTTVALARAAAGVITVEVYPPHLAQARRNVAIAGLLDRVTFVAADIMDEETWARLPGLDAAFLDPDWAVTGPGHIHRFRRSTTRPPADALLERVLRSTRNAALVLPPALDIRELDGLPRHERQKLFLGRNHELYCLYFGDLMVSAGETEFRIEPDPREKHG